MHYEYKLAKNRGTLMPVDKRKCLVCKENCIEHEQNFLNRFIVRGIPLRHELHSNNSKADACYTGLKITRGRE